MSKIEDYRVILQELENWDSFLLEESRLPGPRANLELAFAAAYEGDEDLFQRYAKLDEVRAPRNSPMEFLAVCGVLGLGYLVAQGQTKYLTDLKKHSSDSRWRVREAVALGLQQYGKEDIAGLVEEMEIWMKGNPYERRAVVAALCEPVLLRDRNWASRVLDILDWITNSILEGVNRRSASFKALRKGLGYGWSVAVVAQPDIGMDKMEKWMKVEDRDIRWIMKQNLKKKRLARMDSDWAEAQLERLG